MKRIRTRYAPSPTGYLHIGGARTALFSFLYAKHFNGDFIIRIEDTDISRNIENGENSQLNNLEWLGIIPDESPRSFSTKYGPYRQSEKLQRYNKLIDQLLKEGKAYKAYETSKELDLQRKYQKKQGIPSFRYEKNKLVLSKEVKNKRDQAGEYTIRLALKENTWYKWKDIVRDKIIVNTNEIGDFVIKKQDGYPTYNFAVVVDDYDMQISHILRGEEHITNTPKQLAIYDALNWEAPEFGHLTTITNMDGKKLSKRDLETEQFIENYKKTGYNPQAIFNFLALLGWTHPNSQEILSKNELIKSFVPERLSKSSTKFDLKKMNWFSKQYIKKMQNSQILNYLQINNKNSEWVDCFIETYKQNAITYLYLQKMLNMYDDNSIKILKKNNIVKTFSNELNKLEFNLQNIQLAINNTKKIIGIDGKDLFIPIRQITTYQKHGPELVKAIYLFGEKTIKSRLK